jgi:hypothetical protein
LLYRRSIHAKKTKLIKPITTSLHTHVRNPIIA